MTARDLRDIKIQPVILSGGTGTRLWPLSRVIYPKQLIPLTSKLSMLQEAVRRVSDADRFAPPFVVCNDEHRFIVAEQLRELGVTPRAIVLEPEGRNTAPAAAVAALMSLAEDDKCQLLILPSDHIIRNLKGFLASLHKGTGAARNGALVTFGVKPGSPETGYGYIEMGDEIEQAPGCYSVARFVEKPSRPTAESLLATGDYYWNSGMFLFAAKSYLREIEQFQPDILAACRAAVVGDRRIWISFASRMKPSGRHRPSQSITR